MSAFSDLFARFPSKVMALLVDECCYEQRPVYLLDTLADLNLPCDWCERQALYIFREYDANGFEPPLPNLSREATCGRPNCVMVDAWFYGDHFRCPVDQGVKRALYARRRRFQELHGKDVWDEPKETRLLKALVFILEGEARSVAKNEKHPAPQAI